MVWFKVDDQFWGHPKQTALPAGPIALWVRAGSWASSQLTDGFVPGHMVTMLGGKKRDAQQLVTAGLWEQVEGGYQFHDWGEFQPTREHVLKERADAKERMSRRRKGGQSDASSADVRANNERTSPEVRLPRPDPTRPSSGYEIEGGHLPNASDTRTPLYSDRCSRHADVAEPGPCGACADVRKANQQRPPLTVVRETQHCWVHDIDYREICNGCEADRKAAS
jgi:hypothetical protein